VSPEQRIATLEAENDLLREEVARLERALFGELLLPVEWRLTPQEQRVVGVLLNRDYATKDAIMAALYRDLGKDEAEIKIVDVFVCKARKKLSPFGIEIHTIWGKGYSIDAETRSRTLAEISAAKGDGGTNEQAST
jgi:two-component system cell cycle response regulator CtrA